MDSCDLCACYAETIIYVNILGQTKTAGKIKRMHGDNAKSKLHPDCPITDLLAQTSFIYLLRFTNKTNGGSKYVDRTSHRHPGTK